MEQVRSVYTYIVSNQAALVGTVTAVYVALEFVTRLTPTKTDDSLLSRAGSFIKKGFDLLGIKNNIKVEAPKTEQK